MLLVYFLHQVYAGDDILDEPPEVSVHDTGYGEYVELMIRYEESLICNDRRKLMKKIACEMCGSPDLVKQDGFFVCQHCGCKYTVEEAKKLMIDGVVEVKGTVKVDNSDAFPYYLQMAQSAIEGTNAENANKYSDKALEIDPQNAKAWKCKMQAASLSISGDNYNAEEQGTAGKNAIKYAEGSVAEKEEMEEYVYCFLLSRAQLYFHSIAQVVVQNYESLVQAYNALNRIDPYHSSEQAYGADSGNLMTFYKSAESAAALFDYVPEEAYGKYLTVCKWAEKCADSISELQEGFVKRLSAYKYGMTGTHYIDLANQIRSKAKAGEKIYQEQRLPEIQRRRDEYWKSHPDEKKRLEKRLTELKEEKEIVALKIKEVEKNIAEIKEEIIVDDSEYRSIEKQIDMLTKQKTKLGLFSIKERKNIQQQIDKAVLEKGWAKSKMEESRNAQEALVAPKIKEQQEEGIRLTDRNDQITSEIEEIQNELEKGR